jgi:glycerophosphoryl diester phosphodiesterase
VIRRAVISLATACVAAACTRPAAPQTLILAHAGRASAEAPENSFAAVEAAIAIGADGVEVDLQVTSDGKAVLFHDAELSRMTGREGLVASLTLDELVGIPLRGHSEGPPQTIPGLDAFLDRFGGECTLFLEMKTPSGPRAQELRRPLVDAVGRAVTDRGLEGSTLVSSLDRELAELLAAAWPDIRSVCEFSPGTPGFVSWPEHPEAPRPKTRWLGPEYPWVTAERLEWAKRHYEGVSTYTPNALEDLVKLMECGADAIITDTPQLALLWRNGVLENPPAESIRILTDTWPSVDAVAGVEREGEILEVLMPAESVLRMSVPAVGGEINFVEMVVERVNPPGPENEPEHVAVLVNEELGTPAGRVVFDRIASATDEASRRRYDPLRFPRFDPVRRVWLNEDGRGTMRVTFLAQPSTRAISLVIRAQARRFRLRDLSVGVIDV